MLIKDNNEELIDKNYACTFNDDYETMISSK
jgi:hypothetical protein